MDVESNKTRNTWHRLQTFLGSQRGGSVADGSPELSFSHLERKRNAIRSVFLSGLILLVAVFARAQDPLKVDPAHYKLEFENDQVKVIRVYFDPHSLLSKLGIMELTQKKLSL
jgi:hypothetical protein